MGNACGGVKQKPSSGTPQMESNQGVPMAGVMKPEAKPAEVAPVSATETVAPKEEVVVAELPAPVIEVSQPKAQEVVAVPAQVAAPTKADTGAATEAQPAAAAIVEEIAPVKITKEESAIVQPPTMPVLEPVQEPEVEDKQIEEETQVKAQNPLADVLQFAKAQKEQAVAVEEEKKDEPDQPLPNSKLIEKPAAYLVTPQNVDTAQVAAPAEPAPKVAAEPAKELTYFERMKLAMEEIFEKKQDEAAAAAEQNNATAAKV